MEKKHLLSALLISSSVSIGYMPTLFADNIHQDIEEQKLLETLKSTSEFDLDHAIKTVSQLISLNPNFKLANLLYADLMMAKAHAFTGVGSQLGEQEQTRELIDEARARWQHLNNHGRAGLIPANLLRLHDEQEYVIVIDTSHSRLFLFRNQAGKVNLIEDYYVSIGKNGADKQKEGDKRTPLGVYFVNSFLSPDKLPDYYGRGAFPINYPNQWDQRKDRTGYGIWLHGNPLDSFSRPPLASDGCVTINNRDFEHLMQFIDTDGTTPVVIGRNLQWVNPNQVNATRDELDRFISQWKQDWESLDSNRYLSHYAENFQSGRKDQQQWFAQKQQVNADKTWVKVKLDNLSIFQYPEENIVLVKFMQNYSSNNYNNHSVKTQYWSKQEDGEWKIIYEGSAS